LVFVQVIDHHLRGCEKHRHLRSAFMTGGHRETL